MEVKKDKRNIVLMISSDITSTFGSTIFMLAMMWVVYDSTHSAFSTAVVGVLGHIATLVFSPIAGVFVDSHNPLKVLRNSLIASASILFSLFLTYSLFPDAYRVSIIYLFIFLLFISYSFTNPAETKVIPKLVNTDDISKLYGYRSTSTQISELGASSLVGFVILWAGFNGGILINVVAFLISAFVVTRLKYINPDEGKSRSKMLKKEPSNLRMKILEGFRVVKNDKKLFRISQLCILLNVASMLGPLWVVIVSVQFNGGAREYGFLQAFGLIGGALAGVIAGKFQKYVNEGVTMAFGMILNGLLIIIISRIGSITLAYFLFFFILFSKTTYNVLLSSILAIIIPDNVRGRVSGLIQSASIFLVPIVTLAGGAVTDWIGVSTVFLISGLWTFSLGIYAISIKEVRRISSKPSHLEVQL